MSYRTGLAALLALLFVTTWSLQTTHGFLLHTDHHDRPACSAEHDEAATHIHDTRYATDGCTLCAFVLSPVSEVVLPALLAPLRPVLTITASTFVAAWSPGITADHISLRGPPAL